MQTNEKISPTAYDDAYRTLLEKCSEFMFLVLHELFGEEFSGDEQIASDERFLSSDKRAAWMRRNSEWNNVSRADPNFAPRLASES